MKIINISRKIIGIDGEPLLPGSAMELPDGYKNHPVIAGYMEKGMLAETDEAVSANDSSRMSDLEKARIADEAVAQYKKEQEALITAQAQKQAEINAVKEMKKADLLLKAAGMGLEVKDSDTVDVLKEKILAALA